MFNGSSAHPPPQLKSAIRQIFIHSESGGDSSPKYVPEIRPRP